MCVVIAQMVYCMADIHGDLQRFHTMLDLIQFSDDDVLYILGDVVDRGPDGIAILRQVMDSPNMRMSLGNHEQLLLDAMGPDGTSEHMNVWMYNGGESTYDDLMNNCSQEERERILEFLENLPDQINVTVNKQRFCLVHACPSDDHDTCIWGRPWEVEFDSDEDCTVVCGHTPTYYLREQKSEQPELSTIWSQGKVINIDCGCGHNREYCRLACLRLNDMAQFYV